MTDVETVIDEVLRATTESTGERYAGAIRQWAEWCEEKDQDPFAATALDIRDYLSALADQNYAYQTLKVRRAAITKFFDRGEALAKNGRDVPDPRERSPREPHQWSNPSREMTMGDLGLKKADKKGKRDDALDGNWQSLSPDEVEKMIDEVPPPKVRNELLLRLMYEAMLRRGEVASLKSDDIKEEKRIVTIQAEISKTGEDRKVPWVTTKVDNLLGLWESDRKALEPETDYLFVSQKGGRLRDDSVSRIVRTAAEKAGVNEEPLFTDASGRPIAKVTGHELRRAGARRRWDNGIDIYTIKELLGHEDVSTTQRYIRAEDEQLIEKGGDPSNW